MPSRFQTISIALVLVLVWAATASPRAGQVPATPIHPVGPVRSISPISNDATLVGATVCATCHQRIHDEWKGGRHSKMLQPATETSVVGDFAKGHVTLRGSRYRFRVEGGQFFISETFLTGKEREHRVEYTLGSRRIQHYLTTLEDGRIIVLPPSWDVQRQQWFHNMEIVRPDEDDQRIVQEWSKNCVGCHVSEEEVKYNPATRTYAAQWRDFGTSCERCHGPGSEHVEQYTRSEESRPAGARFIVRPTRLDPNTSSMICAQCHSLRDVLSPGFKAGENYYDYFLPVLEYESKSEHDPAYWPDGRPRRFSNDAIGLWQSACFLRGAATCTSCHQDPHEPNVDRNPNLASTNNALCTKCHEDLATNLTAHTRHGADSAGSSCVECHMPKTVISIKATMRDHTISLPAPENTVKFGIPNACTECHKDKKASWAVDALNDWWPQGQRGKLVARAEAFTAGRATHANALDRLIAIAADDRQGPLIQANALGYLRKYGEDRAVAALLSAANAEHPAIRSTALLSLRLPPHGPPGQRADPPTRSYVAAALEDPLRSVRLSALVSLVNIGGAPPTGIDQKRFHRVSSEFAAKARLYQDDPTMQASLGAVHLLDGEFDLAATALENSASLEPDRPSTTFLLALARLGQHRFEDARVLLKKVPESDPYYKMAQERLRLLPQR